MRSIKKPFIWLLLLTLVVSVIPTGLVSKVSAAPSAASFFIPDDQKLRETALLSTEPVINPGDPVQISRDNVLSVNTPKFDITGTFSYVTADTMTVKVEQLSSQSAGKDASGNDLVRWVTDSTHFVSGTVTKDTSTTNDKFKTSSLQLFSGFNKITLSGKQGSITRSDVFYVLYDKVPYVKSLILSGSSLGNIYLNEGTRIVSDKDTVMLQGEVQNATDVTVAVNNRKALVATLTQAGKFFSPSLDLVPGLNTLKIQVKNASDSIDITREIYYFSSKDPFVDVNLEHGSQKYPIKSSSSEPILTNTTAPASGNMEVRFLVPNNGNTFQANGSANANVTGGTATNPYDPSTLQEETILGPDGKTIAYRMVTLKIPFNFALDPSTNQPVKDQSVDVTVNYGGNFGGTYTAKFKYLPGETAISNMYYAKDYKSGDPFPDVTKLPKLDGTEVSSPDFYIVASSDNAPNGNLNGTYLPLSSVNLNLSPVTTSGNNVLYHVTGFSTGNQQVKFWYGNSAASYIANIAYVSKEYIYVADLYDGQTYTLNSNTAQSMKINGEYRGFQDLQHAEYFVNGLSEAQLNALPNGAGTDTVLGVTATNKTFDLNLKVDAAGPLYYGENRIVFKGTSSDGAGNTREIRKELRIYIIDSNISNINQFHPALASDQREPFSGLDLATTPNTKLDNILKLSPEFEYKDDKYITTSQKYDLVLRGNGASIINVNFGSQPFFSSQTLNLDLTQGSNYVTSGKFMYDKKEYNYDFAGGSKDFVLRIKDVEFEQPGSHVYNLELINSTGARTSQRLEVTRELSPYRILSPKPTSGDQIVVNKNFVRFDIEAEGATKVLIGKEEATKRSDMNNRFFFDYVGLKPNKSNKIKIQIVRANTTLNDTIDVYYTSAVAVDSQYMPEKVSNKYSVFNKSLELTFPKGTVLQSANVADNGVVKFYPDNKILFAIADPSDGVVERRNDYGNIINVNKDERTPEGKSTVTIPRYLAELYNSTANNYNFSRVSNVYWVNGGLGEVGYKGDAGNIPATNGLAPYSIEGNYKELIENQPQRKLAPSQRGTLKLGFDANVVDAAGTTITVFHLNDNYEWENVGGAVDTKAHTITVPFDDFGYYMVMKQDKGYSDITQHPWAREILNALYAKGIMNNMRNDAFGADDLTTRGEFATLLVKGLSLPLNYSANKQTYFDVVPGAKTATWDWRYIETASKLGIVTGIGDGYFGADDPVTREQAAVMIARALKLKLSVNDDKLYSALSKSFMDAGKMERYSRPAIQAVTKAKIMSGTAVTLTGQKKPGYNFNPDSSMTRAEAGKIAVELLKKSSKIFPKTLS
ncbi:hypothetical protein DCC85_20200 [Paenibacillus sp. CAA11]|uniref:S-layer homology domain-containing protein n=1 Tax=Paenibacillus sp. CAA11 TaxID=1532905 RepID=UPI000D351C12|nr:S-layer homology domain-containing protein [Paenibacillus sp. CAA11]AWB46255.1 hypothetical protein DCC85_20200 [Paenibacillus sp. CAA11]